MIKQINAGVLRVFYAESGPPDGVPVLLLHGFPYDIHAWREVAALLAAQGCRVIVPYLRGFGPTRFLQVDTPRSGQQAALAQDLLALMDALALPRALLAGYDWGGRAACIVSALWPGRVLGLVSGWGYHIQNIAAAAIPQAPEDEFRLWYQYYFHGERGREGLRQNRQALCELLWRLWSPQWDFDEVSYALSAKAFDNPDFVEIVIHSYRHRFALVAGDPALDALEQQLAAQPKIGVPTVVLAGAADGVTPEVDHHRFFTGQHEYRSLPGIGHNLPQEAPQEFAAAVLALR
jgi:pimeloyl-ACP methyl ester carboxylesterase